jgi:FAD/FMN-containing dehydrogenase
LLERTEEEEMNKGDLLKIVGENRLIQDKGSLEKYSSDMSFVNSVRPDCIVKPRHLADVEKIIKLANETSTPLVPVSSGPPHFRGDTVPALGGAVIVDLSEMDRVIRVDRQNRVAMIEPGVTFGALKREAENVGLKLNMPLLPRESKSVVGSLLEREPVMMPGYHWDISDPLACVEVVFGTGDTFRTGSAAGPGTIEEQWAHGLAQTEASGPQQASWHRLIQGAQGTMGIVTWASLKCELLPKIEEPFMVGSSGLAKILELLHWLVRLRLVSECFVVNGVNLAAIMAKQWPDDYHRLKALSPAWVLFFNIAGYEYLPEERVHYQTKDMMDAAQRVGIEPLRVLANIPAGEMLNLVRHPSREPHWKLRYKGACHDVFFLSIYDRLSELVAIMYKTAEDAGYPASEIGVYLQPIVQGTSCHCEFNFFYDSKNASEAGRARSLSAASVKTLAAHGAFFSRPYGEDARAIINRDAATAGALRKIKAMFDPNNIMNPGKLCF